MWREELEEIQKGKHMEDVTRIGIKGVQNKGLLGQGDLGIVMMTMTVQVVFVIVTRGIDHTVMHIMTVNFG